VAEMIKKTVYPRIGFLGNPSDGFRGKTIGFPFRNFAAEVILWPSESLKFILNADDQDEFASVFELYRVTQSSGYYGGVRLMKAAITVFVRFCQTKKIRLHRRNFTLEYRSTIPLQRGLAGSSAIITGTIKALIEFYYLAQNLFPPAILASIVLEAETRELGIAAGLQDRVVQAYNRPVFMDFSKEAFDKNDGLFGSYKPFSAKLLPAMGLVWNQTMSESGKIHSDIKSRFEKGDKEVILAMEKFAEFAGEGMKALNEKNFQKVCKLINANFDLRRRLYGDKVVGRENIEMVETVRSLGAAAKFPGSGGSVVFVAKEDKIDRIVLELSKREYQSERIII